MVYLLNPYSGSVDTQENWAAEGYTRENSELIEVELIDGEWLEKGEKPAIIQLYIYF